MWCAADTVLRSLRTRCLCWCVAGGLVWAGGLVGGSAAARAGEFYSWIDASGTMVITDDPGQIPPPVNRSSVFLHQFDDLSQVAVKRDVQAPMPGPSDSGPGVRPAAGQPTKPLSEGLPKKEAPAQEKPPAAPPEAELPPIVVGQPEEEVKDSYRWVPLTTPLYLATGAISGYWYHRNVISPEDAFQRFLRMQRAGLGYQAPFAAGLGQRGSNGPLGSRSGNAIYDQVVRERRALIERNAMLVPFSNKSSTHGPSAATHGGATSGSRISVR